MKRLIALLCTVIVMISVCGCGKVHNADIMLSPSQRYTEKELETAANVTKYFFLNNYDGRELKYISYNNETNEKDREDNLNRFSDPDRTDTLKDVIRLDVCYTDENNAELCEDFYLARYEKEGWKITDHGFV